MWLRVRQNLRWDYRSLSNETSLILNIYFHGWCINIVTKIGSSDFKVYIYFVITISDFWFRRGNFTGHVSGKGQKAEDYYVYLKEWFILYVTRQGRLLNVRSKRKNICRKATWELWGTSHFWYIATIF